MAKDFEPKSLNDSHKQLLETMIDAFGLANLLILISDICHEKALHLQSARQDQAGFNRWQITGTGIQNLAYKVKQTLPNQA